jgi:hypothetical protein
MDGTQRTLLKSKEWQLCGTSQSPRSWPMRDLNNWFIQLRMWREIPLLASFARVIDSWTMIIGLSIGFGFPLGVWIFCVPPC